MKSSSIALCLMALIGSEASSDFLRKMKRELKTCDSYCNDLDSDYCSDSELADLEVTFDMPEGMGDGTYAKCYVPWIGDGDQQGKTQKVRCPPANDPDCETCGWSFSSDSILVSAPFTTMRDCCPGVVQENGFRYNYDYDWNIAKAYRSAYDAKQGSCYFYGLFGGCNSGYNCRDRSWWGKGTCTLDSDTKFHGESCNNSNQCNGVSKRHVNMVCSMHSKKCMLSEEAHQENNVEGHSRVPCECSLFDHGNPLYFLTGFIYCPNYDQCGGNYCTLPGFVDGQKYCDHDGAVAGSCSNCRASDAPQFINLASTPCVA